MFRKHCFYEGFKLNGIVVSNFSDYCLQGFFFLIISSKIKQLRNLLDVTCLVKIIISLSSFGRMLTQRSLRWERIPNPLVSANANAEDYLLCQTHNHPFLPLTEGNFPLGSFHGVWLLTSHISTIFCSNQGISSPLIQFTTE